MGWLDKAVAVAKIAGEHTAAYAKEIDAELQGRPAYVRARSTLAEAKEFGTELSAEVGETQWGASVGAASRSAAATLIKLPVLNAVTDAAKARNGIAELHALLVESPADPERAVWLAEALDRTQADLIRYRRFRSLTSPTYAAKRQLLVTTLALGADQTDPTRTRLLKSAYVRLRRTLEQQPQDPHSLHTLSRVYLGQGDLDTAALLAKLSISIAPDYGLTWVSLARCYEEAGALASARAAARRATDAGESYGFEVLARLVVADRSSSPSTAIEEYARFRSLVTPDGRRAYLGVALDPEQVLRRLKQDQTRRAMDIVDWFKGGM